MMRRTAPKKRTVFYALGGLSLLAVLWGQPWHWLEPEVDFNAEVRPILNAKCITCHGGVKQSGGFSLLFREDALGNTKSGRPAIIPGHPGKSAFIKLLTHPDPEERMPLGKDPLTPQEIAVLERWVRQGTEWQDHWAFVKPEEIAPPAHRADSFVRNGIDPFILEKLPAVGLKPSPEAPRETLLRRVTLDLTGLPPTPQERDAFLKDPSPDAYEKVVDRLLASPHFGERWAALWLDLARYSDTKGYEKDLHRNIWRYRDYLIRAFNDDKPFDQFTVEQLAGDLLPNPTEDQRIATAFHRNTMNNDEGGTDNEEFRTAAVIDRVNTTFDVWQGLTMSCVQCHSHPYDPIRQEEYYRFMSYLNNTRDNDLPEEIPLLISPRDYDEAKATEVIAYIRQLKKDDSPDASLDLKAKRRKYLPAVNTTDCDASHAIEADEAKIKLNGPGAYIAYHNVNFENVGKVGCNYLVDKGCNLQVRLDQPDGPLVATLKLGSTFNEWYYKSDTLQPAVKGVHTVYFVAAPDSNGACDGALRSVTFVEKPIKNEKVRKELDSLRGVLAGYINPRGTPVLEELPPTKSRKTHVFVRGNWMSKGPAVTPGVPKTLNPLPAGAPNNRLGMARWLVSPDNPLTARVAVNRYWEQLFGYGIVETLEDFGSQGAKPTHPELLDWLAVTFQKDLRWSTKKLLKLLVTSGTYRQSSVVRPEHLEKDPYNKYYARAPRVRLPAEAVRDQALSVAGLLSPKLYGPSVMPYIPDGVFTAIFGGIEWKLSRGEDRYRRALYTYQRRTSPYPSLITFDAPSREVCTLRRVRTNTPLQALVTLNDTVFVEAAIGLARRMMAGAKDPAGQVRQGFRLALLREPDARETEKFLALHQKASRYYQEHPGKARRMIGSAEDAPQLASLAVVANALMNLDEFVTKE
jgi:hypothetical protein